MAVMGAWGTAIFSDDTASDIRSEYRELIEDKVPDREATRRVVDAYKHLDSDEEHLLWLALAAAQSQVGRLDDEVRTRALEIIDSGRGLELWAEAGPQELAKRKAVLQKLGKTLAGPQPPPKTLRRPWRHVTDLQPGDVLANSANDGHMTLFRVVRIDDDRVGAAPIIERLDWKGTSLPKHWRLKRLKVAALHRGSAPSPERPAVYRVAVHRKKDPDWLESGFSLVARLPTRADDERVQAWLYCSWASLGREATAQNLG
jgi:hypothetical protein